MFEKELRDLADHNLLRSLVKINAVHGPEIEINGRTYLSFCSNDYLGLGSDQRLVEAGFQTARHFGWGAGASRLLSGNLSIHEQLEDEIAKFKGVDAALLFASGYQANMGAISTLTGPSDLIVSDEYNHASIIDGCRLSRAETEVYPHRNLDALEKILSEKRGDIPAV